MSWEKSLSSSISNPFGRVKSQRNWEGLAGGIEWILHNLRAVFVRHYVDNLFDFVPPISTGPDWKTASLRSKSIFALMKALGAPFHEVQIGTCFHALGWRFDTARMLIIVTNDKGTIARALLRRWASMASCSLREVERLIGFLSWLSLAFFELLPALGRVLDLKRAGYKSMKASGRNRNKVRLCLSLQAQSDVKLCQRLLLGVGWHSQPMGLGSYTCDLQHLR
jgi:hypothetical protein